LAYQEREAFAYRCRAPDELGVARFEGIRAERVEVLVGDGRERFEARTEVMLESDGSTEVDVRLGGKRTSVHVTDREGVPLAGAWVRVRSYDGASVHGADDTDAAGRAEFAALPSGMVLLDVSHGVAGRRVGVPIDASTDIVEFVLEAKGGLGLRVRDGDQPLAGVTVRMETAGGTTISEVLQTNSDGACRFEAVGAGSVRLALSRSDCWPVLVERVLGESEEGVIDVSMRLLGDIELTLRNRDGLAVAGRELALRSIEFDFDVARWLAQDRIRAPTGLHTDSLGRLVLEGLPRGAYSWALAGAAEPSGTFEVAPGHGHAVGLFLLE
jgi:hypothetical protein